MPKALPERGRIGIFNRSHYEEVLVVTFTQAFCSSSGFPATSNATSLFIWKEAFSARSAIGSGTDRNGTHMKFFSQRVAGREQRNAFSTRINIPERTGNIRPADARERVFWHDYMNAYEGFWRRPRPRHRRGSSMPADKWFARLAISEIPRPQNAVAHYGNILF